MTADVSEYVLEPIATLEGHAERVWQVAWNPNPSSPLLASCSADKTVRLWSFSTKHSKQQDDSTASDAAAGLPSFTFANEIATGHRKTVRTLAWSPSGKSLATGSFDSTVSIWERSAGEDEEDEGQGPGEWECTSTLEGHESECKSVAYSHDGALIASSSRDKSVWIWEVQPDSDFECLSVLIHHTQDVKCIAWHPHEELLASGSYDDTILLYVDDPSDDWFPFQTLTGHTSTVWSLAFSPCGTLLASSSDDRSLRIWRRMPKVPIVSRGGGLGGQSSNNGQWVEALVVPDAHERSIYSISWTSKPFATTGDPSKGWIASTGSDGRISIWNIEVDSSDTVTATKIVSLADTHGVSDVNCVSWCKTIPGVLASAGDDYAVRVWRIRPQSSIM